MLAGHLQIVDAGAGLNCWPWCKLHLHMCYELAASKIQRPIAPAAVFLAEMSYALASAQVHQVSDDAN